MSCLRYISVSSSPGIALRRPLEAAGSLMTGILKRQWRGTCPGNPLWCLKAERNRDQLINPPFVNWSFLPTHHTIARQLVYSCICCTLRSGLHEIPIIITTYPNGLENNHACKWIPDNFPRMLTYILFLEILLHAWLFLNPRGKVLFLLKSMGQIFPLVLILLRTYGKYKWLTK